MTPVPGPGDHGGDGARLAAVLGIDPDDVLDLSASLNPLAPDITRIAARHLGSLRRYPDAADATAALADAIGVDADRVLLTNGGAEAIALVAEHVGAGWVEGPEFSLYARHLPAVDPTAGRWRSNPNNPTGRLAAPTDTAAVWDEAFYPLATGAWTRGDAGLVVGSLTKLFAAPGLRLGYVLAADPDTIKALAARQPQWSVSGLATALLPELVARAATDLSAWHHGIAELRRQLVAVLEGAGCTAVAADAPWVLVPQAGDLRDRLAAHGILVRDCASFGPDLVGTVRIAVPDADGLARLAAALGEAG